MPRTKKAYEARRVRGGEIILRTRSERIVFIGGLAAAVLVTFVLGIVATMPH